MMLRRPGSPVCPPEVSARFTLLMQHAHGQEISGAQLDAIVAAAITAKSDAEFLTTVLPLIA